MVRAQYISVLCGRNVKTYQRPHATGLGLTACTAGDLASHLYKRQKSHKKSGYEMVFNNEEAFLGEF
jgi:hypothetical protein